MRPSSISTRMLHAARTRISASGRMPIAVWRPYASAQSCLAALEREPFYAMKLIPRAIGTFLGFRVDGHARVLNGQGAPISGL